MRLDSLQQDMAGDNQTMPDFQKQSFGSGAAYLRSVGDNRLVEEVSFPTDARASRLQSGTFTINTSGSITIPNWAQGFRLYPNADIRFMIDSAPQAASGGVILDGGTAKSDLWESRTLLNDGNTHTLYLLSAASMSVVVEVF
jgi:hypothetical protein